MKELLVLAWLVPLAAAPLALHRRATWLPALAALPGLAAAALVPAGTLVEIPWALLGMVLGLPEPARPLFAATALVWLVAGLHAAFSLGDAPRAGTFRLFFLLTMAGNLGLLVARDAATFYVAYGVMGVAAYGLVAHVRSQRARFAGRVYLAFTVVGEVLVLSGLLLLGSEASALSRGAVADASLWGTLLALAGFGIKMALPLLHLWQPLVYSAAPAPAAAVLAGAAINAGLFGLLSFLPFGRPEFAGLGQALVWVGMGSAFYAVAVGLVQRRAETVLAYSSMSKMGLLAAGIGVALDQPAAAPAVVVALLVFAVHHGLAKAGLFLALERLRAARGPLAWGMLGALALALAGAPLTSGALAKNVLTQALPGHWAALGTWLSASAVATTVLMLRFLWLAGRGRTTAPAAVTAHLPALALALLVLAWPWLTAAPRDMASGGLPVAFGLLLGLAAWRLAGRPLGRLVGRVPPGDLPRWLLRPALRLLAAAVRCVVTPGALLAERLLRLWPFLRRLMRLG